MLCSVPAGKSGSNWLNRLRSNKGFPTSDDLDLDHFLTQNPNSSSSSDSPPHSNSATATRPEPQRVSNRTGAQDREWFGVMNNVLSELFFMGGSHESSRLSGKKFPRKQTNPRICAVSTSNSNSSVVGEKKKSSVTTASFNSDSNSAKREGFEVVVDDEDDDGGGDEDEEEENGEKELKGYSRSEVTVIDTSFGCWKSEKVVFRRKNVWKVREKKGKLRSFGRKKRKGGGGGGGCDLTWSGVGVGLEKKAKALASQEANAEQAIKASSHHEGQNLKNDSMEEVCKATAENLNTRREEVSTESPGNLGQDFRRRSRFSGSPKKMKKRVSSVVLIKGIPTGKKNAVTISPNCPKGTQRQHKA